jgi:hypothetical protein
LFNWFDVAKLDKKDETAKKQPHLLTLFSLSGDRIEIY